MANANAIADKLKDAGLRHGEKLGVAIASALFVFCIFVAAKKETINTDPDKIKAETKQSESNLNRHEETDKIIQTLEAQNIKDSRFAKDVDDQVKTELDPTDYKAVREWVSTEPGAGLIRETPVLIAPSEIYAYPGRGGFLIFDTDSEGNRLPDDGKGTQPVDAPSRRRRKKAAGGMMGGGMMGGGGARRKKGSSGAEIARQEKEAADLANKRLKGKMVGGGEDAAEAKEEAAEKLENFKELTRGHRWVAITGVFDHARLVANYRAALKNPAFAHPNYARVDLERQTKQPDGSWSGWEAVNSKENLKILDNLPEVEEDELTPENVRPEALVDPLPFLKSGLWEKVHVAALVPKEKREIKAKEQSQGGFGAMRGGGMMGQTGMGARSGGDSDYSASMGAMMNQLGGGGRGRGGALGGGGLLGGGGATESAGTYWKTDEKRVMIRAFDFTVKADNSYRYRVRIVVHNPNLNREDVIAGTDTKVKTLRGPWCDPPSDEVHMPPDVMPYAISSDPPSLNSDMKVKFQVIRFRPADGVTVTRNFPAGPGEVIGEPGSALIPSSDGTKPKTSSIDFNSRQIVLDIIGNKKTGGYQHLPAGLVGPPIERPTIALLLRNDGSVAVHNEVDDVVNEVRRDIDTNYKQEIKDSGKRRERSTGMGMGGMMGGGMGGMRGGGGGGGMR
jgi:hypothetical protein